MKFLYFVFVFFILGCNQSPKKEVSSVSAIKGEIIHREFGRCDTLTNNGAALVADLWESSETGRAFEKIRLTLTEKVIEFINSHIDSASLAAKIQTEKSIETSYSAFAYSYNSFKKDFPQSQGCWEIKVTGDTLMVSEKLMTYQIDNYAYTGGAHSNSHMSYLIFDRKTGDEVDIKTFVADSGALLKKVELAFRKKVGLSENDNLEKAGYFLSKHKFFVPHNYTFTRKGVLFFYNRYEIAPYAVGIIKFIIPYSELGAIIKKDKIF